MGVGALVVVIVIGVGVLVVVIAMGLVTYVYQ